MIITTCRTVIIYIYGAEPSSGIIFKVPFSSSTRSFSSRYSSPAAIRSLARNSMPRRSSGGRSAPRAAPRPAAHGPPPQPVNHAPPPAPAQANSGGSMLGNIGSTIAQGMAFGTGSAMAHRAVDAVMGPRTIQHETVVSETAPAPTANSMGASDACNVHMKAFQDCVNSYGSDISKCQFYMDMLTECRRNSGSMMSS